MNIISWNINGLNAIVKKGFFESIKNLDPHILCLQETKASTSKTIEILSAINEYHIFCNSAVKKGYSGTVLLSKIKPISVTYDFNDKVFTTAKHNIKVTVTDNRKLF